MYAPVMGTIRLPFRRTNNGLFTVSFSLRLNRSLTITFNHFTKDMFVTWSGYYLMFISVALMFSVAKTYLDDIRR